MKVGDLNANHCGQVVRIEDEEFEISDIWHNQVLAATFFKDAEHTWRFYSTFLPCEIVSSHHH